MTDALIDVPKLVALHDELVARWHEVSMARERDESVANSGQEALLGAILDNHARNFELWHEEDQARDPQAGDAAIARVKRAIDGLNQARNNAMERVDEQVLARLPDHQASQTLPLHSETVGSIVDRLSILSLKRFHMNEQAERSDTDQAHRASCRDKLAVLNEQRRDLAHALAALLEDLRAGRKGFKVYRQMKMYNDPSLNPVLYGKEK